MANALTEALIQLLAGSPQAIAGPIMAGTSRPGPPPGVAPQMPPRFPQEMMPPPMRPEEPATLPGGSFAPQAAPAPMPVEADAGNPLMALFGGKDPKEMFRAFAAGAAAPNSGGDPFRAFGLGMGGSAQYYDAKEETQYDRGRDSLKDQRDEERDARDYELRRIAEARAGRSADLNDQQKMLEIRREAKMNGLTVSQMLEVERVAQAAAEGVYDDGSGSRQKIVDAERQRLLEQIGGGKSISDPSLSNTAEITATGPNGEKMVVRDGAWVPQ